MRADPFALAADVDLSGFAPTKTHPRVDPEIIREISEENGYPARKPVAAKPSAAPKRQRRWRTGRNVQFSLKTTAECIQRFAAIADSQGWVFGHTLDRALTALERELAAAK